MRIIQVTESGRELETGIRISEDDILVEGLDVIRTCTRIEHATILGDEAVRKTGRTPRQ